MYLPSPGRTWVRRKPSLVVDKHIYLASGVEIVKSRGMSCSSAPWSPAGTSYRGSELCVGGMRLRQPCHVCNDVIALTQVSLAGFSPK